MKDFKSFQQQFEMFMKQYQEDHVHSEERERGLIAQVESLSWEFSATRRETTDTNSTQRNDKKLTDSNNNR